MLKTDISFNLGLVTGKIDGIIANSYVQDREIIKELEKIKKVLIITKDLILEDEMERL